MMAVAVDVTVRKAIRGVAMADSELPTLPEGQREIMEIVWEQGEVSVFEVREILGQNREISRIAVRTTMERLEEKGWLAHRVIGRTHFYRPLVSRDVSLGQRIVDIVDKACGGEPERLMAALMDYRGLTADENQRIQAMLEVAKKNKTNLKLSSRNSSITLATQRKRTASTRPVACQSRYSTAANTSRNGPRNRRSADQSAMANTMSENAPRNSFFKAYRKS
jgi:BlaI family penicillinase repressor